MNEVVRISPNGTRVRTIPARVQRYAPTQLLTAKKRVAAYARVSTDQEEQQNSYEAQVEYYTRYIQSKPEWEFVEVYADEGITGTNTKRRKNFNRMIEDALAGKIDLIITKSVSRFARNTVDTLTTIRSLKDKGIGVFFEKENIDTLDSKGELLITIMGSLAQEESRSISENVTWGWRKRLADGKVSVGYSHFLGYEKGEDGNMQIVESEAEIVRQIYGLFLDGQTPSSIAALLTESHIPTPAGKEIWQGSTVKSILTNEKYKGDALLQKTFTVDFLNKKQKINEGEVPQYYVENSHPAIVTAEVFDLVQYELRWRKRAGRHTSAVSVFSNRLVCGECGALFGSKVWHSNDPYRCMIWRCNRKYARKGERCSTPHLREEEIQTAFIEAVNQLITRRDEIIAAFEVAIAQLYGTDDLVHEVDRLKVEEDVLCQQINDMIQLNATTAQDQDEYNRRYDTLVAQCEAVKAKHAKAKDRIAEKNGQRRKLEAYIRELREADHLVGFDESLFTGLIDSVAVHAGQSKADKTLVFRFRDGTEIPVEA